jgi:hypothetical protein
MTKTITEAEVTTATALDAEYRRLAYAVSQGDTIAAIKLEKIEQKRDAILRQEQRAAAAQLEASRLAAEAEREAAKAARQAEESAYTSAQVCKRAAYALVEDMTAELAIAIEAALIAGDAARAAAMKLDYSAGRTASSEITDFVAWKLGRLGAGLSDMPSVLPAFRQPLVQPLNPKES